MAGISTADITKILRDPKSVSGIDAGKIAALKDTYPYFVTAQYIDALQKHLNDPFSDTILEQLYLYKGNWLLLHQWLEKAVAQEQEATPPTPIPQPADIEPQEQIIAEKIAEAAMIEEPVLLAEEVKEEPLIKPVYTEDYFRHQGVNVSGDLPEGDIRKQHTTADAENEEAKSLMVVMSFSEWLAFFKTKSQKEKEEEQDQRALKTMWQKEKLAAALEEENDIIPENVFEMAVNSITKEDDLASESLAEIYVKQGKYDKAIDMYRKLSLRNPQKNTYFARQIETILKEKQS
jgi:tetratricopeptide (TPR) repeat protein